MMEQCKCPICTKDFQTGALLLRKHLLKPGHESHDREVPVTGWEICPEDRQKIADGFFPMIVIDPNRSEMMPNGNISLEGAYRTGEILYLKKEVAERILNVEVVTSFSFIDEAGAEKIKNMANS